MDFVDANRRSNFPTRFLAAAVLITICMFVYKQSLNSSSEPNLFSYHEGGVTHVLVTGGHGYIGSHAALRLLKDSYRVTIVDNLSRGNIGAVRILQQLFPEPGRLQFIKADLGDAKALANMKNDLLQDWKVSKLEHVFILGNKVRFVFIPEMLKNAPMALDGIRRHADDMAMDCVMREIIEDKDTSQSLTKWDKRGNGEYARADFDEVRDERAEFAVTVCEGAMIEVASSCS